VGQAFAVLSVCVCVHVHVGGAEIARTLQIARSVEEHRMRGHRIRPPHPKGLANPRPTFALALLFPTHARPCQFNLATFLGVILFLVLVLQYILNDSEQKSTARVGKPYSLHPTANPATSPITLINATACRRIAGAWCVVRGVRVPSTGAAPSCSTPGRGRLQRSRLVRRKNNSARVSSQQGLC